MTRDIDEISVLVDPPVMCDYRIDRNGTVVSRNFCNVTIIRMLTDEMIQRIIVCGSPENDGGQRGQCIRTLVHGILLD